MNTQQWLQKYSRVFETQKNKEKREINLVAKSVMLLDYFDVLLIIHLMYLMECP